MSTPERDDVVRLHNEFFNVIAEAFPDLADLHYGLAPDGAHADGLLAALKRVRTGQRLLLTQVAEVADMASWPSSFSGLDLGCGLAGTSSYVTDEFGFSMTGLNINAEQARTASRRLVGRNHSTPVSIVRGDGRCLPFPPSTFDFVVAIEVFFHVPEKDVLFGEVARVLRPGGKLVLVDEEWSEEIHVLDLMFYPERGTYERLASHVGLRLGARRDLSPQVVPWMRDYAHTSSLLANVLGTFSIALRGRPFLAWRFARGLTYFNRLILEDVRARGIDVSAVGPWGAIHKLRNYLADSLEDGTARHEVLVFDKTA